MWVDHETADDLVNFAGIARTITELIVAPHLTPLTIGVHGDWGYGKSSVLRMVEAELSTRERVLTLYFNGWAFEGFEDAKVALMDSIISELAKKRSLFTKAQQELGKLARRVRWFKVARKLAGLAMTVTTGVPDPSALIEPIVAPGDSKSTEDWLKEAEDDAPYRHIHEFREDFARFLELAEIDRLVIFVDDLDRCLPEHAIATLEAIRLFLSVKGSTFVIGADEAMIEYAARQHFPDITRSAGATVSTRAITFSKNYLEKLIQLPFRLPQLTTAETRRYITLLLVEDALRETEGAFSAVLESVRAADTEPWKEPDLEKLVTAGMADQEISHSVREAVKERLHLAAQIARPLADRYVGNPRQVKRFLNTLMLRIRVAVAYRLKDNVSLAALAKLMVLERRNADAYGTLSASVAGSRNGQVPALAELEKAIGRADSQGDPISDAAIETVLGKGDTEQLRDWLKLEPTLGDRDLRAYFFVSRERLVDFVGGDSLSQELQELVEILGSGNKLNASAVTARFGSLSRDHANVIAEVIFERVRENGDLTREPNELKAIEYLVKSRPELQMRFIRFLEGLPMSQLGTWPPARLVAVARDASVGGAVNSLLGAWQSQSDNVKLARAAKAAATLNS
ncbi:MAG TPA: Qat anti-phage system ATPase QatA [Candidatus Elarobacter sp.]|nr:Qat anti-phage system ATPase QatA [Candidatus Elarobacter sp.]